MWRRKVEIIKEHIMGLDGVAAPTSPVQSGPIVPTQTAPEPPESEPEVTTEEEGGPKANGAVRKLESGHFKGKGVSDIRLRIAHFDNPELEPVDPEELLPVPEDGPGKAYEKFLTQYEEMYEDWLAVQTPPDPEEPVDEGDGALAALEELFNALASQEESETFDVVV